MFHLGFAVGDLRREVVVLGLTLLVVGPVGVAEVSGAVQIIPWGVRMDRAVASERGQRWRPPGRGGGGVGGPSLRVSGVRKRWKPTWSSSSLAASRRDSDVRRRKARAEA